MFIASEGYLFIDVDYSQIEGRMFAQISGDPVLIDYYKNGGDIHTATSQLLNVERKLAKVCNFAIIYGCNPYKLVEIMHKEGFNYTIPEAKKFINDFWSAYKVGKAWRDGVIKRLHKEEAAYTMFGRRRRFPKVNDYGELYITDWGTEKYTNASMVEAAEREAVNHVIQGSAADLLKIAMVDIHESFQYNPLAKMLLQVHDELLFEAKLSKVDDAKTVIVNRMESAVPLGVPIIAEAHTGINWNEVH